MLLYQDASAFGCPSSETDSSDGVTIASLPAGLFGILNGVTFFIYIPCVLGFVVLWKGCGKIEGGREYLVKLCFGKDQSADTAAVAEKIGVGAVAVVLLLFSAANVIVAGVAENCGTPQANAFIALNVFVTLANIIACTQVSSIYYGGFKKCIEETGEDAVKEAVEKTKEFVEEQQENN